MSIVNHSENSTFREKLIEHLFIGELLKHAWKSGNAIEVSKPEVDNSGYDIVLESNQFLRHVQLKSSYIGGRTSTQKIHLSLAAKPSGCVVWIYFHQQTLDLGPFLYFGNVAGNPLSSIENHRIAKHTKGNKDGVKTKRPNLRIINKGSFDRVETIEELYHRLF